MFAHLTRRVQRVVVAPSSIIFAYLLCSACGSVGPTQRTKDVGASNKPFRGIECEPGLVLECEPACGRGDMSACEIAGIGYLQGVAVTRDLGRARIMLERSCEAGHALACSNYAKMAQDNQGVTLPPERQLSLLRRGCEEADNNACYRVGKALMAIDNPNEHVLREARLRFEKACDGGEKDACFVLGLAAKTGRFGARDVVKASRLLTAACNDDNATACYELADLQSTPNTALTDPAKARKNLDKACSLNTGAACAKLAEVFAHGVGVPQNTAKAQALHATACELDQVQSCLTLGLHQLERDPEAANLTLQKACEAKLPQACFERAQLLEGRTKGVQVDREAALDLYEQACSANVARACTFGGLLTLALNPKGLPQTEREQVVKRIERGCSAEREADACRHWGAWLSRGEHGVTKDGAKAATILGPICAQSASREDTAFACYELGRLNEYGDGVARNVLGAGTFYQKACAVEHQGACLAHASLMWHAQSGYKHDPEGAVGVFRRQCHSAAKDSQSEACVNLANAEMTGLGTARNVVQGKLRLQAQCDAGLQSGCAYLGQFYVQQRGDETQVKRGESMLRSACDSANGRACFFLAERPTLPASQRKELGKRACLLGVQEACAPATAQKK